MTEIKTKQKRISGKRERNNNILSDYLELKKTKKQTECLNKLADKYKLDMWTIAQIITNLRKEMRDAEANNPNK